MRPGIVIVGGGLSGCLAALALKKQRPEAPLLLIEESERLGGNHIWSFFDTDVSEQDRWLVDPIVSNRWTGYDIAFPARRRTLRVGYNTIRSEGLDRHMRQTLGAHEYRLRTKIVALGEHHVTTGMGENIAASAVIDARGAADLAHLDLGWQKFVGRVCQLETAHGLERPIVMDATVDQIDGYRFVYCLPFSETRLLIEDTYYADGPELDRARIKHRIDAYAVARRWRIASIEEEEAGVLPVTMGGDFAAFWPEGEPVTRFGLRGGFFHPTTGYSLPDAVRTAVLLVRHADLGGAALARRFRAEAGRIWRERRFYRLLNRMLFRAADPAERYRVLEHFYRLDADLISRFYAARSTMLDKLKTMSGRPPVSVRRALTALR